VAIDEHRFRIRRSLEEKLGVEEASYLMDRPIGGWSDLVTNRTLDLKIQVLDERFAAMDRRFESLEHKIDASITALRHELLAEIHQSIRAQTWALVTVLIAALGMFGTLFGLLARN
jgi:hypothetical protein